MISFGWKLNSREVPTQADYDVLLKQILSGVSHPGLPADLFALNPRDRASLADALCAFRDSNGGRCLEMVQESIDLLSQLSLASAVSGSETGFVRLSHLDLQLGDVVQSTETHWLRTRQHLTGAIVHFEPVPKELQAGVGSDHWVYLNSGEGPIGLSVLEKTPAPAPHNQKSPKQTPAHVLQPVARDSAMASVHVR